MYEDHAHAEACEFYFTSVIALSSDFSIVGGHLYSEGPTPSRTFFFRIEADNWLKYLTIDQIVYAVTKRLPTSSDPLTISIVARDGQYIENPKGQGVTHKQIPITSSGYLLDARWIDSELFTCGDMYQIYRNRDGVWHPETAGLPTPRLFDEACMLKAIDGFSSNDIYAVGSAGAIWHWDGSKWKQLDQMTNLHLYSVVCATDGNVYIGGGGGVLFKGRVGVQWADLTNLAVSSRPFHNIIDFRGTIYIAANEQLLALNGTNMEEIVVPLNGKKASFYALDSVQDAMWCVGDACVLSYDGKNWVNHATPRNLL